MKTKASDAASLVVASAQKHIALYEKLMIMLQMHQTVSCAPRIHSGRDVVHAHKHTHMHTQVNEPQKNRFCSVAIVDANWLAGVCWLWLCVIKVRMACVRACAHSGK